MRSTEKCDGDGIFDDLIVSFNVVRNDQRLEEKFNVRRGRISVPFLQQVPPYCVQQRQSVPRKLSESQI